MKINDVAAVIDGYNIKPYRLRSMLTTAGKIMDLMVKSDISVSYEEMRIILSMVSHAIEKGERSYDDKRQAAAIDG